MIKPWDQGQQFKLVAIDSFYGRDQGLLQYIHDWGLIFLADIPVDTFVWTTKPARDKRPVGAIFGDFLQVVEPVAVAIGVVRIGARREFCGC